MAVLWTPNNPVDTTHLYLLVMAGGSGTRFWPKSTAQRPKQFLSFGRSGERLNASLLAQTIARFDHWILPTKRMILTTQSLKAAVANENLGVEVLAEPMSRNTAPCLYWATQVIYARDPKAVMIVVPSDHHIADTRKFIEVVKEAAHWAAENDDLVTLGIRPTRPETGYGYLKTVSSFSASGSTAQKVEAFVEKPTLEKAKTFLDSGDYLWNGGMFVWRAEVVLRAFNQWMPEMKSVWEQSGERIEKAYPQMTATSIDYGVMEKAKNVVTFPLACGWDDLGSWTSLESLADSLGTQQGANIVSDGSVLALDSSGNIVDAPGRFVTLLGVDDLIVVQQGETLLVARKDRAQEIRRVVDEVKKSRPDLA